MVDNALYDQLKRLQFTAGLAPQAVDVLAAEARCLDLPVGAVVFREGSPCDAAYVVASGHLALDMQVVGRGPVKILTIGPGELLGWSGVLGGDRMTATATTLEPTRLIAIPAQRLAEMAAANHEFGYHWMRAVAETLARRLVATRLQLLDLFADSESAAAPWDKS